MCSLLLSALMLARFPYAITAFLPRASVEEGSPLPPPSEMI